MHKVIKGTQQLDNDPWIVVSQETTDFAQAQALGEQLLLPLTLWLEDAKEYIDNPKIGVWLKSDEEPEALLPYLTQLQLIAIDFPVFTDGRGYSQARRLRLNFDYKNELRAIGDVLRDQMQFYRRCGFDSFALREDADVTHSIEGLEDFSVFYQDADDNYKPPFARH